MNIDDKIQNFEKNSNKVGYQIFEPLFLVESSRKSVLPVRSKAGPPDQVFAIPEGLSHFAYKQRLELSVMHLERETDLTSSPLAACRYVK